jgi:hypothetical protein
MNRPQFSLKSLLWLMAVVAAFFGGAAWQHRSETPIFRREVPLLKANIQMEDVFMPNGDVWIKKRHIDVERLMAEAIETARRESASEAGD